MIARGRAREERSAVIVEQREHHRLSFLTDELEPRVGECLTCGQRMDVDGWLATRCPGEPEDLSE